MFKKLWLYLTGEDFEKRDQIIGVRILVVLLLIVLISPFVWHNYIEVQEDQSSIRKELDSLRLVYLLKKDSLDKIYVQTGSVKYKNSAFIDGQAQKLITTNTRRKTKDSRSNKKSIERESLYVRIPAITKFRLNTARAEDLTQVYGIGDVFAERIIKYRTRLGGFYDKSQLYQVYGLDSSTVEKVFVELLDETNAKLTTIKINEVEFKTLLKHPYMEYEDVKRVFNSRPIYSKEMFCRLMPNHCDKMVSYLNFSVE